MASLGLLLLSTALLHTAQSLPAARSGGRGLEVSVGGVRRYRRDLHNLLPYEDQMMSYPAAAQGGGGANDLYYQSDDWRGQGLEQALQRLVERDQRREQEEEQRAAYLAALLRLLSEAESAGLVGPGDVELVEEEDDRGPADYDETGRGVSVGHPAAAWWGLLEPQLARTLLDRVEPQLAQTLLQTARQQEGRVQAGLTRVQEQDPDSLRRLVARILSSSSPNNVTPGRRARSLPEPVSSTHRRTRRSIDDMTPPPSPSNAPPLLRVKRLEEEEDKPRPPAATALQRMKRIDDMEEANYGSRKRQRRAALNYNPQVLIHQILEYMRE